MSLTISLRKSAAIQIAINELLKSIPIITSTNVNIFQNTETLFDEIKKENLKNSERIKNLFYALEYIRISIGNANHTAGINELLAKSASLEKMMLQYSSLASSPVKLPDEVLTGTLKKLKDQEGNYYHKDYIESGIYSKDDIGVFSDNVQLMKRKKQTIKDQLLELNIKITIELPENIVETLVNEKIL